jgi:hypothetical protein
MTTTTNAADTDYNDEIAAQGGSGTLNADAPEVTRSDGKTCDAECSKATGEEHRVESAEGEAEADDPLLGFAAPPASDANIDDDVADDSGGAQTEDDPLAFAAADTTGPYVGKTREELLGELEALTPSDGKKKVKPTAAKAAENAETCKKIVAALIAAGGMDSAFREIVVGLVRSAIGGTQKGAAAVVNAALTMHTKSVGSSEADRLAEEKRQAELAQQLRDEQEKAALEAKVGDYMRDPQLMQHIVQLAHDEGVVLEEASILVTLLVVTSRLTDGKKAMAMLRRGAPSSGKNYVVDVVLKMLPNEDVIMVSGASSKAIYYLGGSDENSLKRKVLYIPEAAAIAARGGDEHELTLALRNLLGEEGVLTYITADAGGNDYGEERLTRVIRKNGPIAVILTSARENVEPELCTRLIENYSDEKEGTTHLIQTRLAQRAAGQLSARKGPLTLEIMREINRLLDLNGPQTVIIPFAPTMVQLWQAQAQVMVRTRRDTSQVLAAIEASALLHQLQRERDKYGRIVADVEDYAIAFQACGQGMKSLASPEVKPEVIQFVETLEAIFATQVATAEQAKVAWEKAKADAAQAMAEWKLQRAARSDGQLKPTDIPPAFSETMPVMPTTVRASYEQITRAMGVSSKDTVATRARAALAAEVVEKVEPVLGHRRTTSEWRIKVSSKQLRGEADAVEVLPTVEKLRMALAAETVNE